MLYPSLYQINTRILLQELGRRLNRPATLDDVPDADLDQWAALGFDWVWPLGVWQTGPMAREVSRALPGLRVRGLMTMAPLTGDERPVRRCFAALRELRDALPFAEELPVLSMGMTNDFEIAVEEGATLVRIGTAIFG